ncbi:AAA domain (dynein-related subfamily) [Desulfonatronum zhilinae]|nr:AAA domain (dynein-related subfamily) [Desulfonatronum zhilinae]
MNTQKNKKIRVRTKKNIYDYYQIQKFSFSDEIITRYVLSLMTKPFVILTGISGTGKTKIAQLFASYMLQECDASERNSRVAFVSVRPDWLDNKGLLGFYNILDEKYNVTPILKLLLAARDNPDKPHFVILDEMNLAKVEHYFSDFLSIMESRTPDNPQGEALVLHDRSEALTHDGLLIPARLHIPTNVYFTGTVNVDESTYMFSPKVLDRANVIEFNEVLLDRQIDIPVSSSPFRFKQENLLDVFPLDENQPFSSSDDYRQCKEDCPDVVVGLSELLDELKMHNMHFGYRVINEVCRFTRLANSHVSSFNPETVLDIQVVQKILPKFHGTQAKLEEPLNKLLAFAKVPAASASSGTSDYRLPRTDRKLTAMLRKLDNQGYADFIE